MINVDTADLARLLAEPAEPAVLLARIGEAAGHREHALLAPLDALVDHADGTVALAAVRALLAVAGDQRESLATRLDAIGTGHASADVRFVARRALAELRTTPPQSWPLRRLTVEDVVTRLGAAQPEVRLILLDRIVAQRDPVLADPLAGALGREKDERVLARMVSVLKELGTPEHAQAIRPLLSHSDDRIVANAVDAVVHLAGDANLTELLPLLARDDNRLRANLMVALRERFPEQVAGYVRRMLRDARFSFRVSALWCARSLDHGDFYPDVLRLLSGEQQDPVIAAALEWIALHGPPRRAADLAALALSRPELAGRIAAPRPAEVSPPRRAPTRPGVAARPPLAPAPAADPRIALGVAAAALVLLGAAVAWRVRADGQAGERERERARAAVLARSKAHALPAVVVAVHGTDVDVIAHGLTYTIGWVAAYGPIPRAGAALELRGARLAPSPAGFRVVVEEVRR